MGEQIPQIRYMNEPEYSPPHFHTLLKLRLSENPTNSKGGAHSCIGLSKGLGVKTRPSPLCLSSRLRLGEGCGRLLLFPQVCRTVT